MTVLNMKNYWSIDRLLKNVNVLQVGTGKNTTTPLYCETKKSEVFFNEINIKITKRENAFKGLASTYSVKILNCFSPDMHLKDTGSAIKNKLKKIIF